jgi:hypothetical protein
LVSGKGFGDDAKARRYRSAHACEFPQAGSLAAAAFDVILSCPEGARCKSP